MRENPHSVAPSVKIKNIIQRRIRRRKKAHSDHAQSAQQPASENSGNLLATGIEGIKAIGMAMLCLDPTNSSSSGSSPVSTSQEDSPTEMSQQPAESAQEIHPKNLEVAVQALTQEEATARELIEKSYDDELMQQDAFFCVTNEKYQINKEARVSMAQQFFLPHFLALREEFEKEEVRLRAEMETVFADETEIAKLGDDFVEVAESSSKPGFFQSAAAATAAAPAAQKGWVSWLTRS